MISEIALRNVRVFGEPGEVFRLPKLTVLTGTNSCGKSTVLKSLLLLRQTLGISESSGITPDTLRFVGSQVDLGTYDSFVFCRQERREICIGIGVQNTLRLSEVEFLRSLSDLMESKGSPGKQPKSKTKLPYILKASLTFASSRFLADLTEETLKEGGQEDEEVSPQLTEGLPQGVLREGVFTIVVDGDDLLTWRVVLMRKLQNGNRDYKLIIPREYFEKIGGFDIMDVDQGDGKSISVRVILSGVLPSGIIAQPKPTKAKEEEGKTRKTRLKWQFFPLPPLISHCLSHLNLALQKIHYLGPLRSPAKRYYVVRTSDFVPSLDSAGEFLPNLLVANGHAQVSHVAPGQNQVITEKLVPALAQWLCYLRTGEELSCADTIGELKVSTSKNVLVELEVKSPVGTKVYPLADSGFGYSQVLPILVRGLLTPKDGTLILEQPELHLNPALQVRLAKFLVHMARTGKQVVVETHSEHIVNSIRVLCAEDETGELANDSGIFFLDIVQGSPVVRELSIQSDGTVTEWPQNFFGEAASLAGRLLRAQKRFHNTKS
jgi:predicted ATPase